MRFFVLLISLILPSATFATESCLSTNQRVGATYGTAEFAGEPWVHTWTDGSQTAAPGHQIKVVVGDETVIYGADTPADLNSGWFDNLGSIANDDYGLGGGPYTIAVLRDGQIGMFNTDCDGPWPVRRNQPSNPVPVAGYEPITEPGALACVANEGIIEYIELELERGYNKNPLGEKLLFASYGAGRYVTGFDTWGKQISVW